MKGVAAFRSGTAGAKARRILGLMPPQYGDVVRFTIDHRGAFPLSDPLYDARFMWISTQYEDAAGYDVVTVICIRAGGPWNVGDLQFKNPGIFEVVA